MIVNENVDTLIVSSALHNTEHRLTTKSIEGTTQSLTFVVAKSWLELFFPLQQSKERKSGEFDTQLH